MQIKFSEVVELSKSLAWPVITMIILLLYRKQITVFLGSLTKRATKLTLFNVSIELATLPQFAPDWSIGNDDARKLSPAYIFDSAAQTLFDQIADNTASDYAIINLGSGDQWLTSRLFIFAVMLQRMRALKCFVFLEKRGEVSRRFLGTASPENVRWILARHYPWLETAFAEAYETVPKLPYLNSFILTKNGAIDQYMAKTIVRHFLEKIQSVVAPIEIEKSDWISFKDAASNVFWEHAAWYDGTKLAHDLRSVLWDSYYLDSPDLPANEKVMGIIRRKDPFVAMIDDEKVFLSLIDRKIIVDNFAEHYAAPVQE